MTFRDQARAGATMTDEQLDEARAREAWTLAPAVMCSANERAESAVRHAARLAREGWVPVDPDLIEAREIVANVYHSNEPKWAGETRDGYADQSFAVKACLTALKRGRELERGQ